MRRHLLTIGRDRVGVLGVSILRNGVLRQLLGKGVVTIFIGIALRRIASSTVGPCSNISRISARGVEYVLTVLLGMEGVISEATDGSGSVGCAGVLNGARTPSGWWLDLGLAGGVDYRSRVDGRHPDADLVLLEKIGHKGVEVDISLRIVVECELVVVTMDVSNGLGADEWVVTYACNSASKISI